MSKFKVMKSVKIHDEQPKNKNIPWIDRVTYFTLGKGLSWQEANDLRKKNKNSFITFDIERVKQEVAS